MKDMYRQIAIILLIVGGLNGGLFGLFGFDLISAIFGSLIGRLIFIVIGVGAGYMCYLFYLEKMRS